MSCLTLTVPNSPVPTSSLLHPVALLSILTSHTSRPSPSTRTIGTLMGRNTLTANGAAVEVTAAFPVPHREIAGEISEREQSTSRSSRS